PRPWRPRSRAVPPPRRAPSSPRAAPPGARRARRRPPPPPAPWRTRPRAPRTPPSRSPPSRPAGTGRARSSCDLLAEPDALHRAPVVVHVVRQHEHVAQGAPAVPDLVAQERLALEPEVREHSHRGLLLGDHLDRELAQPRLRRLHDRV